MKTFCATHHVSYELGFTCPRCTCCRCGSRKNQEQLNPVGACRDQTACEATSGKRVESELEIGV